MKYSVLDLAPISEGSDAGEALRNSRALARRCDQLNYSRFWMAEHHSMAGIASAATAVCLAFVAEGTERIRIGAGGIMLPNHSPLQVAEQFGTLAALYPGRIDLGLGRAPGTDRAAMRALRRGLDSDVDRFPNDVLELINYLAAAKPNAAVRAIPGEGLAVPIWILGSSLYGAQLAAHLGLPYAFASHFAPAMLSEAIDCYRDAFQPSVHLDAPYVMLGYNVFAADTDERGELLASSMQQAFVALRSGRPGTFKPPVANYLGQLGAAERALLSQVLSCSAIGAAATVGERIGAFASKHEPDELILTSQMFEASARLRCFEIVADVVGLV